MFTSEEIMDVMKVDGMKHRIVPFHQDISTWLTLDHLSKNSLTAMEDHIYPIMV